MSLSSRGSHKERGNRLSMYRFSTSPYILEDPDAHSSPINSHAHQPKSGKHWNPYECFLIRIIVELFASIDVWDPLLNIMKQHQQSRGQGHFSFGHCIFLLNLLGVTLVNKIIQVPGAQFHNTSASAFLRVLKVIVMFSSS